MNEPNRRLELHSEAVEVFCEAWEGMAQAVVKSVNASKPRKVAVTSVLFFFTDRTLHAGEAAHVLANDDIVKASASVATLGRLAFESAVNLLFLLQDPSGRRLATYFRQSVSDDLKLRKELESFRNDSDPRVAGLAAEWLSRGLAEDDDIKTLLENLELPQASSRTLPQMPERCRSVGKIWSFLYPTIYRTLSGFSHGHASRMMNSSLYQRMSPSLITNASWDTLEALRAIHTTVYHLIVDLGQITAKTEHVEAANRVVTELGEKFSVINSKIAALNSVERGKSKSCS